MCLASILTCEQITKNIAVHCRPSVVEFDRLSEALHSRNMGLEDFVKELREAFVRYVTLATS